MKRVAVKAVFDFTALSYGAVFTGNLIEEFLGFIFDFPDDIMIHGCQTHGIAAFGGDLLVAGQNQALKRQDDFNSHFGHEVHGVFHGKHDRGLEQRMRGVIHGIGIHDGLTGFTGFTVDGHALGTVDGQTGFGQDFAGTGLSPGLVLVALEQADGFFLVFVFDRKGHGHVGSRLVAGLI